MTISKELFNLFFQHLHICEPDQGFMLKDIIDWKCDACVNRKICKLLIKEKLL